MSRTSPPQGPEWPTLALIAATYAAWAAVTVWAGALTLWFAVPALALILTLHSSLQHEALHGHPLPSRRLSDALVYAPLGLAVPYPRFRDLHLAHHRDANLTDPYDDPESNYLDPGVWRRLPAPLRALLSFNNTLLGRMLLGPAIALGVFLRDDWRAGRAGDARVRRAWALHALALAPVALWIGFVGAVPVWAYLLAAYLALSILKIRTFLEHQAHERALGRTVIIEDRGPLALLFLNNNFHAVHHAHPQAPWYELPRIYAARRAEFLRRNLGYRYASYGEILRQHLLRRKDPVPHPFPATARRVTRPVASLPMYDWPEVRAATDALWAALRDALRRRGLPAPDALSRDGAHWTDPDLALGQTCSLPYRTTLHDRVTLVGALDYGLDGCPPGFYRSALVVRADDPRRDREAFRGARFAFNGTDSQSGWGALVEALGALAPADGLETGAHRASVRAVATGAAAIAAIDAVSWRLAQAFEAAAAARLRVLGWTRPTPGLPLITAGGRDPGPYAEAAAEGVAGLDPARRAALGLCGFVRGAPADYLA